MMHRWEMNNSSSLEDRRLARTGKVVRIYKFFQNVRQSDRGSTGNRGVEKMSKNTIWFIGLFLLLSCFSTAGGFAPSFIQIGHYYQVEDSNEPILVVKIGEDGWIQVESEGKTFWLNTSLVPAIMQVEDEKLRSLIEGRNLKSTMSDIRAIAAACETYSVDHKTYPDRTSLSQIASLLERGYIKKLPLKDAWGHDLIYITDGPRQNYWIISTGTDGRREERLYDSSGIPCKEAASRTATPGEDIILSNAAFLRYPH